MARAAKFFAGFVVLAVAVGFLLYYTLRPKPPVPFQIGSPIKNIRTVPSLTCGMQFAAMVAPDGSLWLWGGGPRNLVALQFASETPQRVDNNYDWKSVTAGFFGLIALKQDGSIWSLG